VYKNFFRAILNFFWLPVTFLISNGKLLKIFAVSSVQWLLRKHFMHPMASLQHKYPVPDHQEGSGGGGVGWGVI
jgi:hypothetical protein